MSKYRKLSRPSDQRRALLRGQVTELLWHGKIKTTHARAMEIRGITEKMLTLAINEYDKTIKVTKKTNNEKGQTVTKEVVNDLPSKLNARRKMMAYIYDYQEVKSKDESKSDYFERTQDINHPLIEKMFSDYGPKYRARNEEKNCGGGYTRVLKLGPRRGDGAEEVIIELV